jgi:hypothetical protein
MWNALLLGSFKKGIEMIDMGVYSSIRYLAGFKNGNNKLLLRYTDQTQSMKSPVAFLSAFTTRKESRILVKLPLLDRDVNSYDVLPDHTASSDVQMPGIKFVIKNNFEKNDGKNI